MIDTKSHLHNLTKIETIGDTPVHGNIKTYPRWCTWLTLCLLIGFAPRFGSAQEASLSWEVANRFGPFEAYRDLGQDPIAVFDRWKLEPGARFEDWHKGLWAKHQIAPQKPFASPYAGLIDAAGSARENALWDPVQDKHSKRIANLARGQGTVAIRARSTIDGKNCRWQLDGQAEESAPCNNHLFDVGLSDATRTLTVTSTDGSQSTDTEIKVKHRLILGFGESYSSGQGNPDIPARWAEWTLQTKPEDLDVTWLNKPKKFLVGGTAGARWLDAECYRSFFNYETLTALKVASDEPHSFVSFLHYACSGAEIFDGLMNPQGIPEDSNRANDFGQKKKPSWYHARSQLHSMIMDLCAAPGEVRPYPQALQDRLVTRNPSGGKHAFLRHNNFTGALQPERRISPRYTRIVGNFGERTYAAHRNSKDWEHEFGDAYPTDGLPACPNGLAKPDLVLLGIGGNDSGFESIVRYYVVPNTFQFGILNYLASGDICPRPGNVGDNNVAHRACRAKPYDTGALMTGESNSRCAGRFCQPLQERLAIAYETIIDLTGITPDRLVTPVYPDPFRSTAVPLAPLNESLPNYAGNRLERRVPVLTQGKDGGARGGQHPNPLSKWNAAAAILGIAAPIARDWSFDVTRQEAELIVREAEGIRAQQRAAARRTGVSLVMGTRDSFLPAPWTAGQNGQLANAPAPYNWDPSDWEPYAYETQARAVRTFNDSLMTQQDIDDVDLGIEGDDTVDFRGAAHPNLTGHRLLAQTMAPCVAAILNGQSRAACLERH